MRINRWFRKRRAWSRRAGGLSVLLVGVLSSSLVHAATKGEQGTTEAEVEERRTSSRESTAAAPSNEDPSEEVFVPTEEISEDYAAPFPVDI